MFIQLPSNLNIQNSNTKHSQISRYNIFTNQVKKVMKEGHDVIILTDDNINSLEDNTNTNIYRNIELKNLKDNMIIENSLTVHNQDPTFFRNNINGILDKDVLRLKNYGGRSISPRPKSCIPHIY